ncbi:hypothetical protein D3C78_1407520 [compost metagenome]
MADEVEALDAEVVEHGQRGLHQEGDADARKIAAAGFRATRGIVGEERMAGERGVADDVGVVLLGRTETVQEDDGRLVAIAMQGGDGELHPLDGQRQQGTGEFLWAGQDGCSSDGNAGEVERYSPARASICKFLKG